MNQRKNNGKHHTKEDRKSRSSKLLRVSRYQKSEHNLASWFWSNCPKKLEFTKSTGDVGDDKKTCFFRDKY